MNIGDEFTIVFIVGPERYNDFLNAWTSLLEISPYPKDVNIIFNPYSAKDYDSFFDIQEFRQCNMIKMSKFESISRCWNLGILLSSTRYVLVCNDDVVFKDENLLEKVWAKHQEGYDVVHATENWSAFSIDKKLISDIGWFDERFMHSWEDIDYRYRMARADKKDFRFEPHLIRHRRSQAGRSVDYWNQSSKYFFYKWNIASYLNVNDLSDPEKRRQLQATGFFRNTNPKSFIYPVETVDFYPDEREKYKEL